MRFSIVMGVPEMEKFWNELCKKADNNLLGNDKNLYELTSTNLPHF